MATDIKALFESIDRMDTEAFLSFLSDDVTFRFGNAEPIQGKEVVGAAVGGFFQSIRSLNHSLIDTISQDDTLVCHGNVTYTRHDDSNLSVPFANVFKMSDGKVKDYLIFVDISQLYT